MKKKTMLIFFIAFLIGISNGGMQVEAKNKDENASVAFVENRSLADKIKNFLMGIINSRKQTHTMTVHYKNIDGKKIAPTKKYEYRHNSYYSIDKPK